MALRSQPYISLASGGGGLDLGVDRGTGGAAFPVCYVENEATAAALLVARMEDQRLPLAPLWSDLRTFDGRPWRGKVAGIVGGYPCQPFSNAGRRLGESDPRHLWPYIADIVRDVEPQWCFFENVGAHLRLGFYEVARSLQGMGYRVAATLLTAEEVGAPHRRERLFILAHRDQEHDDGCRGAGEGWRSESSDRHGSVADAASGVRLGTPPRAAGHAALSQQELADAERSLGSPEPRQQHQERAEVLVSAGCANDCGCVAQGDTDIPRLEGRHQPQFGRGDELPSWPPGPKDTDAWRRVLAVRPDLAPALEPGVRLLANELARGLDLSRSDQLHILGNGVVPAQAAEAWRLLTEALEQGRLV